MSKVFTRTFLGMAVLFIAMAVLLSGISPCAAAIIPTGNVEPDVGTWTSSTTGYVGNTSDGSVLVDAGSVLQSYYSFIGYNSGVSGTATVTGAGSKWISGNNLYIGDNGSGTLRIEAGGQVISNNWGYLGYYPGSSGTATVTGAGSTWTTIGPIYVGNNGSGTLTIEAGGQVSSFYGYLGDASGSSGTATVTGAGSKWISGMNLYVGRDGSGTLTVADGGEVTAQTLYASLASLYGDGIITALRGAVLDADLRFDAAHPAQATFTFGSGGTLKVTTAGESLGAGYKGNGSLIIAEGVSINSASGYLGYYSSSSGTATVTGTGSQWINRTNLYVGRDGSGTLTVADGGEVTAQTLYASLASLYGDGIITASKGAVLDADLRFDAAHPAQATFTFGSGGTLTVNAAGGVLGAGYKENGSLTVAEGVTITSLNGYLGYYSGSSGTATVTGAGSKWTNSDDLYVGYSGIGTLCVEAGGQVSNSDVGHLDYLGYNTGSSGTATVTGAGSTWNNNSSLYVGNNGKGTLRVEAGGQVSNSSGFLGYYSGSLGTATVTGSDSKWTNSYGLYIGMYGSGELTIEAGGQVSNANGSVGDGPGSTGTATVTGAGSTWTNSSDFCVGRYGSGTLRVEAGGQVSNSNGYFGYYSGSTGSTTVTGLGSKWTNQSKLYVGYKGVGTLRVEAGGQVSSSSGFLGLNTGSSGTATVTGAGSTWINSGDLYVGRYGSGTLRVEAGGQVSNSSGYLSYAPGSSGTAIVTGAGSLWTNSGSLYLGNITIDSGTMHIRDGGVVTTSSLSVNSGALLTLDTAYSSNLTVGGGTGSVTNNGKVRVLAGPQPTAGSQYSPITAGTWTGTGICQALGGTWDTTSHVFTVSPTYSGVSGTPVAVDLAQQQRVLVEDTTKDWAVGVSFLAKTGTGKTFDFTGTTIADADLTSLNGLLQPGQAVLSGWNLTAAGSGYSSSDPVYLSLGIPASLRDDELQIWRLNSGKWSSFSVSDLTARNGYASFTVTGLSGGYAVTAAVPEPGMMVLLMCGMVALAVAKRWRNPWLW